METLMIIGFGVLVISWVYIYWSTSGNDDSKVNGYYRDAE